MKTAILLISEKGLGIARQLVREFPQTTLVSTTVQVDDCQPIESYDLFLKEHFHRFDAFLFIGAMGICVRSIAPYIRDKHTDPAVVCIDSTGHYVIPVLSGHIGGANELAQNVAGALGAEAVVTTQSDRTSLWALDTLGQPYGWTCLPADSEGRTLQPTDESHRALNRLIGLFVKQVPTLLYIGVRVPGVEKLEQSCPSHVTLRYGRFEDIDLKPYELLLLLTPFCHNTAGVPTLYYIPRVLHAGIGLAHEAGPTDEIITCLNDTLLEHRLQPAAIADYATICEKREEPVVKQLQTRQTVHFYTADELKTVDVPTPSEVVQKHMGTPSVSEAAALLASDGGRLVLNKQKGSNYTLAVAVSQDVLTDHGHIEIVGAGPGDPDLISVRGRQMLEKADLILYAGSLVPRELTYCAKPGATVRSSASMNLEEQFALMKEFYDRGQFIVRLHTGDPCIYGAIQEQMNYFDRYGMSYHITPGISSFQAAAAALKSQFTIPEKVQSIILTRGEGRTPMPPREKLRLMARSQSTMCIFLSAGIVDQVQAELLQEYPEDTPVAACYHLTWKDERIYRGVLKDLARIVKDNQLTLTTMIVVGEAIDNRQGLSRLYAHEFAHLYRNATDR